MNKTKVIISAVVGIIIVGGGSFYTGMKYGANKNSVSLSGDGQGRFGQYNGGQNGRGGRGGGAGSGFVSGEILSKDDKSVTIKLRDGGSKLIFFSSSTQVMKADSGSPADLSVRQEVTATGSANSDGSVNAQSIQIRPVGTLFGNRTISSTK